MSELRAGARRARRAPLLVVLLASAACGPRLHVESARITPLGTDQPARFAVTADYTGLEIDPRRPLRVHIGFGVRWLYLRPVEGASDVFAVQGSEHGYGLTLDRGRRRVELIEPVYPPTDQTAIDIAIGQGQERACTRIWVEPADGGWTFAGRQAKCSKSPPSKSP